MGRLISTSPPGSRLFPSAFVFVGLGKACLAPTAFGGPPGPRFELEMLEGPQKIVKDGGFMCFHEPKW